MENFWTTLLVIAALLVGVFGGAWGFSDTETVIKEVEVIKEVAVPAVCEEPEALECPDALGLDVEVSDGLLEMALGDFLAAVEDEEDEAGNDLEDLELLECGDGDNRHEFDFDELSVSKLDDVWTVEYDDDKTTVGFEVRMKYKETDERSCRETFNVEVVYEDGEDTEVSVAVAE
ncbi:hypothetical protein LCGC14_2688430 [marine sediment metagenome]|uniref:Uncharacterized protein n=1 Tax=marine sediment metagenome TaxID=412755 RepID=A0A0F8ZJA7_9ZZZZ|nr:hypothetical protein [Candidatus Aminicenantes bacterium]